MAEIKQLIEGTDLSIHVVVPGKSEEIEQMKKEIGINLEINNDPQLSLHKALNLSVTEGGRLYALRGYSLVKNGEIVASREMVEIGELSVRLVTEALQQ